MNDPREPFELDLKAKLDINPSPGLQARIRARAYAEPARRIPWFTWSAGLATAAIAVTFAVLYFQRQPEAPRPAPPVAEVTRETTPARPVVNEPQKPRAVKKPVSAPIRITFIPLESDEIQSPVLKELELTGALKPIPQASIPAVSQLDSISLEPLSLTVQPIGVNQ
jgi:hypothetical protein